MKAWIPGEESGPCYVMGWGDGVEMGYLLCLKQ